MALSAGAGYLIGAGISAAASAASNISNGVQASNLNATNRIWQRQNMNIQRGWALEDWNRDATFNRAMNREAMDWDAAEWTRRFNAENAYNSPMAQMNRLRQAGINPYYAASMIDGGNASGASGSGISAATAPQRGSISSLPGSSVFHPIDLGSSIDRFTDGLIKQAQLKNLETENQGKQLENMYAAQTLENRIYESGFRNKELRAQEPYIKGLADLMYRQANANWENSVANTSALYAHSQFERDKITLERKQFELNDAMQAFNMKESHRMNNAQIQNWAGLTAVYIQNAKYLQAQTWHEYYKGYETILRSNGIYLDNQQKDFIMPYVLSAYQSDAAIREEELKRAQFGNSTYSRYVAPNLGSVLNSAAQFGSFYLGYKTLGLKLKPATQISGFGR